MGIGVSEKDQQKDLLEECVQSAAQSTPMAVENSFKEDVPMEAKALERYACFNRFQDICF